MAALLPACTELRPAAELASPGHSSDPMEQGDSGSNVALDTVFTTTARLPAQGREGVQQGAQAVEEGA